MGCAQVSYPCHGKCKYKPVLCSIDQEVAVSTHTFNMEKSCISTVTLEIDFFSKKNATCTDEYNSDLMAAEFTSKFANMGLRCVFVIKSDVIIITNPLSPVLDNNWCLGTMLPSS